MITITPAAVQGLADLLKEKGLAGDHGLRLAVEKGGCAGLQYAMTLGASQPGDTVLPAGEAHVYLDPESMEHLSGCTLDYTDDLTGAGFRIHNPKAVRSCGCGTSFEPSSQTA